jgi:hypothetical protein
MDDARLTDELAPYKLVGAIPKFGDVVQLVNFPL